MHAIAQAVNRVLRGPRASRFLQQFGIDPKRYWLLMDLFDELSDRGEILDQLGRNGIALKSVVLIYFVLSAILGAALLLSPQTTVTIYFFTFLGLTVLFLTSTLLLEGANSLINPTEALILAHQPINGATYTAAKLSHLLRIVLLFVPGLDGLPALGGLLLKGAPWYYPFLHLAAAFAVGLISALSCCALFGWMVRFIPVRRLKAAGQLAGSLPFFCMAWSGQIAGRIEKMHSHLSLPVQPAVRWGVAIVTGAAMVAAVALGLRSLSADYLTRVSGLIRGGSAHGSKRRRLRIGAVVRRYFGGQTALAGYAFVSRMMLRDWQFRRMLLPMLASPSIGVAAMLSVGWPLDPFSGRFTPVHLLPHILGVLLFMVCLVLRYGNDYKGVWIFLTIPSKAIFGFAGGVHALLWIDLILIPNLIALPLLAWRWGIEDAGLFIAYSIAAASIYLALELKLIEAIPFSEQMVPTQQTAVLPLMMAGGIAVAIAVGLQYYLIFRSRTAVAATAGALAIAAYFATKSSLTSFAVSMRYRLSLISAETGRLFKEVQS
jgi:hypothetical protein